MLNIRYTNKFKADYKQALKRGKKRRQIKKSYRIIGK